MLASCLPSQRMLIEQSLERRRPPMSHHSIRTRRGPRTLTVNQIIEDYKPAAADDFHILAQLHPERIADLVEAEGYDLNQGFW